LRLKSSDETLLFFQPLWHCNLKFGYITIWNGWHIFRSSNTRHEIVQDIQISIIFGVFNTSKSTKYIVLLTVY